MKNLPIGVNKLTLGQAKWQAEMLQNFVVAVISGTFLVFAVLVLLYRRALPPFVNMASLLLAPLGGLIALWATGNPLSLPVFIGLLMLLGIVAKNSILLIDFALEEMNKGVDTLTAIIDAGHKRAQPIVMTTVAMVAGMIPTALSIGGDGSWRAPMGIVVIGGLILSTILTLVIVPAAFSLAVGVERYVGRGWAGACSPTVPATMAARWSASRGRTPRRWGRCPGGWVMGTSRRNRAGPGVRGLPRYPGEGRVHRVRGGRRCAPRMARCPWIRRSPG